MAMSVIVQFKNVISHLQFFQNAKDQDIQNKFFLWLWKVISKNIMDFWKQN